MSETYEPNAERGINTCAYYRGVGTCEFGCQGPDGPACHELGAPGPEDLDEWQQRGLPYSEVAEGIASR